MKTYRNYKDSGVPWLGEIPSHWMTRKLKYCVTNNNIIVDSCEENETYLALKHIEGWTGQISTKIERVEFDSKVKKYNTGDILFGKLRPYLAKVALPEFDGVCVGEFLVLQPRENISSRFLSVLLRSKKIIDLVNSSTFGAKMPRANWNFIGSIFIPLPPIATQHQIARYLDWQSAKVNKFIKARKKLIALLKEQKQNLINKAVTRGLNPDVPMRDSGVEWLGEIPAYWEVRKLKYCICGKLKYGANSSGTDYSPAFPRYIRITDFNSSGYLNEKNKLSLNISRFEEYLLEEGDLLFARSGASVGKVFQCKKLQEPSCFAGYLIKAKPNLEIITSGFLYLYTQSLVFDNWKTSTFNKATIENIGADKYSQLLVVVPSIKEQKTIFDYIEKETAPINKTIAHAEREIELIQEYHTRLISDVVMGKIDVRDLEIPDFAPGEEDGDIQNDEKSEDELLTKEREERHVPIPAKLDLKAPSSSH